MDKLPILKKGQFDWNADQAPIIHECMCGKFFLGDSSRKACKVCATGSEVQFETKEDEIDRLGLGPQDLEDDLDYPVQ